MKAFLAKWFSTKSEQARDGDLAEGTDELDSATLAGISSGWLMLWACFCSGGTRRSGEEMPAL